MYVYACNVCKLIIPDHESRARRVRPIIPTDAISPRGRDAFDPAEREKRNVIDLYLAE